MIGSVFSAVAALPPPSMAAGVTSIPNPDDDPSGARPLIPADARIPGEIASGECLIGFVGFPKPQGAVDCAVPRWNGYDGSIGIRNRFQPE